MKRSLLSAVATLAAALQLRAQPNATLPVTLHAMPMLYSATEVGASGGIRVAADDRRFRIKDFFDNSLSATPPRIDWRYHLESVAADMPILKKLVPKRDILGIGVVAQYGHNGWDSLATRTIRNRGLSAAYHKGIGKHGRNYLSAGLRYMANDNELETKALPVIKEETSAWAASIGWHASPTEKWAYFVAVTEQKDRYRSYFGGEPLPGTFRKHYQTNLAGGISLALSNAAWVCVNGDYYPPNMFTTEILAINAYARLQVARDSNKPLFVYGGVQYMKMRQATGIGPSAGVSWRDIRLNMAYEILTAYDPDLRYRSGAFETSLVYTARNKTKPYNRLPQTFL